MNEITQQVIENTLDQLFPNGDGHTNALRVRWALETIARKAFTAGRNHALMGLMTTNDVAAHFGISNRRARALIANRHERFGIGMRAGTTWLVHRDELGDLAPDEKYRRGEPNE